MNKEITICRYGVNSGIGKNDKTKVLVHKLASLLLLEDVKHEQLLMLQSGDELHYSNNYLHNKSTGRPVAKLSKAMQETLLQWQAQGYEVAMSKVRFVVAWRPKDAPKGSPDQAVLLADVVLMHKK